MLSSYLFKTNFKINEKFNEKGIQKMVFEIIMQKGIGKKSPFQTCPILRFEFRLQNGGSFVKTVCTIGEYNKIPSFLFL